MYKTTQGFLYKSLCRLVAVGIPEQGCGTGLCSGSLLRLGSQPGRCPWAGEVLLTHQSRVKLR